ncbi:MAG: glycosyltransferase [Ardenticatenaceae bacterium]|nr:glycosyltransferase [Anaerolineales bacterium]MCB8937813.1 glycosyltransferase [Ardenticatenaceae bacterium]MCB8974382.1 glycosyltransferase [Ardenticatenaceae bacterium]
MRRLLHILLTIVQTALALLVGYLLLLTGAAWRQKRTTPARKSAPSHRFAILVPAHNEEKLLPQLLQNLQKLVYPTALFDVHVVADNCTDETAVLAQTHGAHVHERFHDTLRGKGYALQWLLDRLQTASTKYDAYVILDADSVVSANFLQVMDARLANGERVIQAYYAVQNPGQSGSISLRYAALAVLHFLRPQGRMALGGSAGLKGNGMVFAAEVMNGRSWTASLTEDIEFHMNLILAGERVTFAPDAIVWAEMPETLADSHTQNVRWEQGRLEMIRHYVPTLLKQAFQRRSFVLFDAAVEQLIPPFSILAGSSLLAWLAAVVVPGNRPQRRRSLGLSSAILLGQVVYLFAGLKLAEAPTAVYKALLGVPNFIIWKIGLYLQVALGKGAQGWVRTERNEN